MSDSLTADSAPAEKAAEGDAARFIWYELMTRDREAAIRFYSGVVGWTAADHEDSAPGLSHYTILSAGDEGVGGIMELSEASCEAGARPGWIGYIGVPDTDSEAREIASSGGRILMEPGDIPNVGRFALVADPGGAPFYLMTPLPRDDAPPRSDPTKPGIFSWHELYSSIGQKAAFDFYSDRFGWESMHEMDMGPMGIYRLFGADGIQLGGMMDKPDGMPQSQWGFYVTVEAMESAIERILAHGGEVRNGPMEVPGGSWIVQAVDPEGVAFNLTSARR